MRLTYHRLKEALDYNNETGYFTWLVSPARGRKTCGRIAGCIQYNPEGRKYYLIIIVDGERFLAHRLAFFWMTGELPSDQIDHIDGNPMNNKWDNLREATNAQNAYNMSTHKRNRSGLKGVSRHVGGLYRARIRVSGSSLLLGYFKTPELAHAAYCEAAAKHFGEFARTA